MSMRAPEPDRPPEKPKAAIGSTATGPLFSDAIRLRPGAVPFCAPAPIMPSGRRAFQEPVFVPQHVKPTSNRGLDIDKLVGAAQTGLTLRPDASNAEVDTDAIKDKVKEIKKWWQRKKKAAKKAVKKKMTKTKTKEDWSSSDGQEDWSSSDGEEDPCAKAPSRINCLRNRMREAGMLVPTAPAPADTGGRGQGDAGGWPSASGNPSGGGRSNNTGDSAQISFAEARDMVKQHAMEVHGIRLSRADTATRQLHARAAEAIACCPVEDVVADKSNVAILHQDEEEEPCGEPMDAARAAEEAVYHAAVVAHRVTSVSTGLRPRSGPEDEVDTQGLVQTLGGIRQWWKATESERAPLPEGEREPETRTMINAHAAKQGVDLRHTDLETFAMFESMVVAMDHIGAMAGVDWEDEDDIGAPAWWERKKQQAKEALVKGKELAGKAKEKASGALGKAKEMAGKAKAAAAVAADRASAAKAKAVVAKGKAEDSKVGKLMSKAKTAVSKFAKQKWERLHNEDRITKMERYDYAVYSSQPLKKVILDKKSTSLPFGGEPTSEKDPLHDPHTRSVESDPFFYGMVASLEKGVVSNDQGDQAFVLDAKETLDILGSDKYREVLAIKTPAEGEDLLTETTKMGYMAGTQYGGSPYAVLDRIRAQNAVQMHAVPSTADSSQLVYPPDGKPNGAHPLCLGHSMMVPVSSLGPPLPYRQDANVMPEPSMGQASDPLSLVRACVSSEWLKQIEAELVASPLRKDFAAMLSAEGAEHTPFIIPMPTKYADPTNLSAKDAALYKQAFPEIPIVDARPMPAWYKDLRSPTYADVWRANEERRQTNGPGLKEMTRVDPNAAMRPVSALLVVPLEAHIVNDSGALKRTDEGGIAMEWQRLYPYEMVPAFTKRAENNPTDTVGDTRKAINAMLKAGEEFSRDQLSHLGYAPSVHPTTAQDNPHAPIRFMQSNVDFQSRFEVAVFALGLSPACDAGGNPSKCEKALDDAGSGNMLMIGAHPLILGKQHTGVEYVGFEGPDQVFVSNGNGAALTNALPIALEGEHFDTRFLWSSMKLLQRSWSKATNPRVSKASQARFRKLVGMPKEQWQNPESKYNLSGWEKKGAKKASFQRRGASKEEEIFGRALEELGMIHVLTGEHLDLNELSEEELATALARAGIDLDAPEHD